MREILPWEKYPPGSCASRTFPESYDRKKYNARRDAHAFIWMVFWGCTYDGKFNLEITINEWWSTVFKKRFPMEGGTVEDLVDRIYCQLIDKGYEVQNIEPDESEYCPPILQDNCANWIRNKSRTIHYLREADMALKLKKKLLTKASKNVVDKKQVKEKNVSRKDSSDGSIPQWATSGREGTKAYDSKALCCKLLLERKHTMSEIALMVESELDYTINEDRVNFYRKCLNKGHLVHFGYDVPNKPVELSDEDEEQFAGTGKKKSEDKPVAKKVVAKKVVAKKSSKKADKKTTKKTTKKPAKKKK